MKSLWPNLEITEEYVPTCYHLIYDKGLSKHEVILGWSVMSTNRVSNAETLKILRIQMHKAGWHKRSEWKTRCTMQTSFVAELTFLCVASTHVVEYWSAKVCICKCLVWTMWPYARLCDKYHVHIQNIMRWEGMTSKKRASLTIVQQELFS